jgi:hypothetical protein
VCCLQVGSGTVTRLQLSTSSHCYGSVPLLQLSTSSSVPSQPHMLAHIHMTGTQRAGHIQQKKTAQCLQQPTSRRLSRLPANIPFRQTGFPPSAAHLPEGDLQKAAASAHLTATYFRNKPSSGSRLPVGFRSPPLPETHCGKRGGFRLDF